PQRPRRKVMPQYLVANYLPDNFDPSTVTEAMIEDIHALNREMIAAGVRKFACGISLPANATTERKTQGGVRPRSHAVRRARCASFCSSRTRMQQRNRRPERVCRVLHHGIQSK